MPKIPQPKNVDRATLRWSVLKIRSHHSAHTNIAQYTRWVPSMTHFPTANVSSPILAPAPQTQPGTPQPTLHSAMTSPVPLQSPAAPIHDTQLYRVISSPNATAASSGPLAPCRTILKPSNANKGNLQSMLDWTAEDFLAIQASIHSFARASLDLSSTLKGQKEDKLKELCKQASAIHPILSTYQHDWATHEFLRRYLKNSSTRAKNRILSHVRYLT